MYQRRTIATTGSVGLGALFGMQPALAQDANVQIYGILIPFVDSAQTSGAAAPGTIGASMVPASSYTGVNAVRRTRLTSGTSALGFRGSENLGAGMKAIFQIESAVPIDGDPGPNTLASRNTHVGLQSDWG